MTEHRSAILRTARRLVDRFGDAALLQVEVRIGELQHSGESEAARLWEEIRAAVDSLAFNGCIPGKSDKN